MRFRTIVLVLFIVLIAGFAALNVDEFTRASVLSLGFATIRVPLGLFMLVLLAAALLVFLASTLYMQSRNVLEARTHTRALNAQRDLADKAEVSRFTELRVYLEEQALMAQRREAASATVLADRFVQQQTLLARIEQSDSSAAARLAQLEAGLARPAAAAHEPDRSGVHTPLV